MSQFVRMKRELQEQAFFLRGQIEANIRRGKKEAVVLTFLAMAHLVAGGVLCFWSPPYIGLLLLLLGVFYGGMAAWRWRLLYALCCLRERMEVAGHQTKEEGGSHG